MLNNFLSATKGTPLEFYSETLSENQNTASYYMYDGNTINQNQTRNSFQELKRATQLLFLNSYSIVKLSIVTLTSSLVLGPLS